MNFKQNSLFKRNTELEEEQEVMQGGVLAVYATQTDPFTAAVAAVNHYNFAGVAAAAAADAPASFKVAFIDELFRATPEAVAGNSIEIQEA